MQSTLLITLVFSVVIAQQPSGSATKQPPEPWEITKFYGRDWLRSHFVSHETLPDRISIPYVEGKVVDGEGNPIEGAVIASHTPRHWVDMHKVVAKENAHGPVTKSKKDGSFFLPERTEPYRILVQHESGVASLSHEDLLYAEGKVELQPWATVEGTFELDGDPVANAEILLRPNFRSWSYRTGGPRVTGDFRTTTDEHGHFRFEKVPPVAGRIYELVNSSLDRAAQYDAKPGEETKIRLGLGASVTGQLKLPAGEEFKERTKIVVRHVSPPLPIPDDVKGADRKVWYDQWLGTDEGIVTSERLNFLLNLRYTTYPNPDGTIEVLGIQPGEYKVWAFHPVDGADKPTAHEISHLQIENPDKEVSLGTIELVVPDADSE